MTGRRPLRVAVLGAGLIGMDLVTRINASPLLDCRLVASRGRQDLGLRRAAEAGCPTGGDGIGSVLAADRPFDLVFDATSATAHAGHWARLRPLGTRLVDLTPSRVGRLVVPTVNGAGALARDGNVNLVSCGGQASIPVLAALARHYRPRYAEVVTTAAGPSVGPATRRNLDEYIATTRQAVRELAGMSDAADSDVKAIVNISPARPPATFRVAMSLLVSGAEPEPVRALVAGAADRVRGHAPGYRVTACEVTGELVFVAVEVTASGARMPRYAGNLDIINSAAVLIAEQYAATRDPASAAAAGPPPEPASAAAAGPPPEPASAAAAADPSPAPASAAADPPRDTASGAARDPSHHPAPADRAERVVLPSVRPESGVPGSGVPESGVGERW